MNLNLINDSTRTRSAFERMKENLLRDTIAQTVQTVPVGEIAIGQAAHWNPTLGFWSRFDPDSNPETILCTYGTQDPANAPTQPTIVETNLSKSTNGYKSGGAFATDYSSGQIVLLHTGKLTGKNVSMSGFLSTIPESAKIKLGNRELVVIGSVADPEFPRKLGEFIFLVEEFKKRMASK